MLSKIEDDTMSKRAYYIEITDEDKEYLQQLSKVRTTQAQIVDRARILLQKAEAVPDATIAKGLCIAVNTVRLCVDKYLEGGVQRALFDEYRKGRPVEINSDAIAWMISIACQHPVDLGYSQELWTLKNLHKHIQAHAEEAGFPRLKTVTKARIQQILVQQDIKPFKIKYYCEKRDPDFDAKIHNVLLVYKQVEMQFDEAGEIIIPTDKPVIHTVSCDEKPGIQVLSTTSEELRPTDKNGVVMRDAEYKRLSTLSLLAGIDLLTGIAIPLVSESHKSSNFINFLKKFDAMDPEGDEIRVICDNHSAHKSKETQNAPAACP